MDPAARAQLASNGLFGHVDLAALEHLLDDCARCVIAAGATLLQPGAANDCIYVVLRGELRVYAGGHEAPAHTVIGIGECVGETSVIDGRSAAALVIAAAETELLAVPPAILWALIERSHGFARNLLATLAGRQRADNLALVTTASRSLEFEQAASVDALTGLHNRRWLSEAFPRAIRRCEQDGTPLCLVMADIDHFKALNDAHGHLTGDAVLRAVARRLAQSLRAPDLVARYGGEEFAVLLPRTATHEGRRIAERLRLSIELLSLAKLTDGALAKVTISCGVAPLGLDTALPTLTAAAESALARAKAGGRNRVEVAGT
ncbi:MAG: GGDEF domain-containing protein [Rhodocyclaceae bacterium]|nr:GGDEF domain-containing protein [Rhodocyclaceae bacterium]